MKRNSDQSISRQSPVLTHASSEQRASSKRWLPEFESNQPSIVRYKQKSVPKLADTDSLPLIDIRSQSNPSLFQFTSIKTSIETNARSRGSIEKQMKFKRHIIPVDKYISPITHKHKRKVELTKLELQDVRSLIAEDQGQIVGIGDTSNRDLKLLTEETQSLDSQAYYKAYKSIGCLEQQVDLYKVKPNILVRLGQSLEKTNLLPKKMGLFKYEKLSLDGQLSKPYVNLFSDGLQSSVYTNLKSLNLRNNQIQKEGLDIIAKIFPQSLTSVDLENNKIQKGARSFGNIISDKQLKLQHINLENNKISLNVSPLLDSLTTIKQLRVLNLSKNNLSDGCVEALTTLITKSPLKELYLHYNALVRMGPFFKALVKNQYLKVLDLSFNRLTCATEIAEVVGKPHPELNHLDIAYNRLTEQDLIIIQGQLIFNDLIYGIHIEGNNSKLFVNPRGFIVKEEDTIVIKPLQQSRLQSMSQLLDDDTSIKPERDLERKYEHFESASKQPELHRRIKSTKLLGDRSDQVILRDCCWICEGWVDIKFTWTPNRSGSMATDPIFLHLDFDNFRPMIMQKQDGVWLLERMCPPNRKIEYFFSNPLEEIQTHARDQKTHETAYHSQIRNFGVLMKYSDGTVQESRPMHILNYKQTGDPKILIDSEQSYTPTVMCKPRQPELIYEIDKVKAQKRRWTLETSFFKDFDPDNQIRMNECLDFDLQFMKINRIIQGDKPLIELLQNKYASFLQLFYYYSSIQPNMNFPRIKQQLMVDFVDSCGIIQKNLINHVDLELIIISSAFFHRRENHIFLEEKSLVRHQFLDFILRIAKETYVNKKICGTLCEAVDLMLTKQTQSVTPAQEWRDQRYWIQIMDITIKYKLPIIRVLFNMARNPRAQFLGPQDFIDFLTLKLNFIPEKLSSQEAYLIYFQSMMTQVDTLTIHRHCQMSFYEFTEALARIAEKLCLVSPAYKLKKLSQNQKRQLPLFAKFEGLIFFIFQTLELHKTTSLSILANETVLKTRQVKKLGFQMNNSDSEEEEEQANKDSKEKDKDAQSDVSSIIQQFIPDDGEPDDDGLSQDSFSNLNTRSSAGRIQSTDSQATQRNGSPPKKVSPQLPITGSRSKFKKSVGQLKSVNILKSLANYNMDGEVQEREEQEESSPMTKEHKRKEKERLDKITKDFRLQMEKFQFDGQV